MLLVSSHPTHACMENGRKDDDVSFVKISGKLKMSKDTPKDILKDSSSKKVKIEPVKKEEKPAKPTPQAINIKDSLNQLDEEIKDYVLQLQSET